MLQVYSKEMRYGEALNSNSRLYFASTNKKPGTRRVINTMYKMQNHMKNYQIVLNAQQRIPRVIRSLYLVIKREHSMKF